MKALGCLALTLTLGQSSSPADYRAEIEEDGTVILDFNKAYSPPCAFNEFATCPLPPKQNRLAIRIEAGERRPPH